MRTAPLLLALLAGPAVAQDCQPFIEKHASGPGVSFRPHRDAFTACPVDEAAYERVLGGWLRALPAARPAPTSIALGRAVQYPWLSDLIRQTAANDAAWRARAAASPPSARDRQLDALLRQPAVLQRLAAPFEGTPYRLAGVTYEKVLWNREGLPYDAQLWLRVAPR